MAATFNVFSSVFIFIVLTSLSLTSALSATGSTGNEIKFTLGEKNFGPWENAVIQGALAPGPAADSHEGTLVLAANRTKRPDILRGFQSYQDGWDIANEHYWALFYDFSGALVNSTEMKNVLVEHAVYVGVAYVFLLINFYKRRAWEQRNSVGFTGAAGFVLAVLWFVSFGLALSIHLCCGWSINIKDKGSNHPQRICLILLIVFTSAVATGCTLLSVGQDKFHGEALHTLHYVVNQSDYTVQTLKNVTEYLSLAKTISVAQMFLPSNIMDNIDNLNMDLNTAADTLSDTTNENSVKIKRVFNDVRLALIAVAAVMLLLALIGLILSILGHQHAILIFVISGWLLVAITFILCGVFMILANAISDTCMAMEEWVENPRAESALSNILPCVDQRTTNQTLYQSKQVVTIIVSVVNTFIYSIANVDSTNGNMNFYNQSGPTMPPLCYPFDSQLQERQCTSQEVSSINASVVWKKYECKANEGVCTTAGRVTPEIYPQLVGAVNESYALEHYAPILLSLQNCNFVRDTFQEIALNYCPPLNHYLKIVNAGLGLISVGVLLCLVLWILYANRPQREEAFVKLSLPIKLKSRFNKNPNNTNSSLSNTAIEV